MNREDRPILLVEDNPMDVDLTQRAFKRKKVPNPIHIAWDGEQALSFISRWDSGESTPLLILLDLKLPKMDGFEVLRVFKDHPEYRNIPVVILSTSTEENDVRSAYQGGANSYLSKPVDFETFVQTVGNIQVYWCQLNIPAQQ
ncbi:MAG: two-component system response regulator [Anaerolineae bacterium UTCFX2]|jgi:CheY-like chemotaxis protein|nr:response regulator [Anaerolineales bacterium]OQY94671.1 MAG: two-component system response regulator [Anaerolineae bacterium UTCFX2]